jgi:hypothetical protein
MNVAETMLRNLLAVVHGDDGSYTEAHGLEKSWETAMKIVPYDRAERDTWKALAKARAHPGAGAG